MSVILVRKESETANISNSDDVRAYKYASCGINGVIKNRLNQIGYEIATGSFTVKSGEIIIDGWQVKVDASGATISLDASSGTRYYVVYCTVDLSTPSNKTATISANYGTTDYPSINRGDDISLNDSGTARLVLYKFVASGQTISDVVQMFELIDGTNKNAIYAQYASSDTSKGTIEQRLTSLGFRQGSVTFTSSTFTASENVLLRQGNYVLGSIKGISNLNAVYLPSNGVIAHIPSEFRPKTTTQVGVIVDVGVTAMNTGVSGSGATSVTLSGTSVCTISTNGDIAVQIANDANSTGKVYATFGGTVTGIVFGYEANPITS